MGLSVTLCGMTTPGVTQTHLVEIRDLATIPLHHDTRPSASSLLGIGRNHAYAMARSGEIPTIRLGKRVVVPVPALLRMLGEEPVLITDQAEPTGQAATSHAVTPAPLTGDAR